MTSLLNVPGVVSTIVMTAVVVGLLLVVGLISHLRGKTQASDEESSPNLLSSIVAVIFVVLIIAGFLILALWHTR